LICSALSFTGGVFLQKKGIPGSILHSSILAVTEFDFSQILPVLYIKSQLQTPEKLVLDINHSNFEKIAIKRKKALERGILIKKSEDWVSAKISHRGNSYDAKIRLKGLMSDHWASEDMWSLDIKIKGDNRIFGMKRFSIMHPNVRWYLDEWVGHKLYQFAGLYTLKSDFVSVTINGNEERIYILEDRGNPSTISNNSLREGLLLKSDFDFRTSQEYKNHRGSMNATAAPFFETEIIPVNKNTIEKNIVLKNQFNQAKNLLELFRLGKIKSKEVFDLKKMGLFIAIHELFGYSHAAHLGNIKFYYNPITSLIEPVGNDIGGIHRLDNNENLLLAEQILTKTYGFYFFKILFSDEDFLTEYMNAIDVIINTNFLDSFFENIEEELHDKLHILRRDHLGYRFVGKKLLFINRDYIRGAVNPMNAMRTYWDGFDHENDEFHFKVRNVKAFPIEILGIKLDSVKILKPNKATIIPGFTVGKPSKLYDVTFQSTKDGYSMKGKQKNMEIVYRFIGTNKISTNLVYNFDFNEALTFKGIINNSVAKNYNFLKYDEQNKKITFLEGNWVIDSTIIIPPGYKVIASSGVNISLRNSASIISWSPLSFSGTKPQPIIINSADSTGGGLVVLNTENPSLLEYVKFSNLANPTEGLWELTGAVTFYQSDTEIINCNFSNNRCEDLLNIIKSELYINNCSFNDTESDAFDGDFINGTIENSTFNNCGNDCMDFSGSELTMNNIEINHALDKGLSFGEKSHIDGLKIKLKNTNIGIASKDLSRVKIDNLQINDSKIGLTSFQKKSEYGPSEIVINKMEMDGVEQNYLVEKGSMIKVDGKQIIGHDLNIRNKIYPN